MNKVNLIKSNLTLGENVTAVKQFQNNLIGTKYFFFFLKTQKRRNSVLKTYMTYGQVPCP